MSKRRLGRGLDALLSGPDDTAAPPESGIAEIALDQIVRGRYQPRRIFTEESLNELAASIRAQGLMQLALRCAQRDGQQDDAAAANCSNGEAGGAGDGLLRVVGSGIRLPERSATMLSDQDFE